MWMTIWLQLKQQRVSDEMISQEILEAEGENKNEKRNCPKQITETEITKPSTSKVLEAIETLVNFTVFAKNNQIWGLEVKKNRRFFLRHHS